MTKSIGKNAMNEIMRCDDGTWTLGNMEKYAKGGPQNENTANPNEVPDFPQWMIEQLEQRKTRGIVYGTQSIDDIKPK